MLDTKLRLKPEIWETQAILYLILAQLVETDWIMWGLRIYAVLTFIMAGLLINKMKREEAEPKK